LETGGATVAIEMGVKASSVGNKFRLYSGTIDIFEDDARRSETETTTLNALYVNRFKN